METQLSLQLRADRALGIPILLWMVKVFAEEILYEMHPDLFHEDSDADGKFVCDYKFSYGWCTKFLGRFGFSLRKHTNCNKVFLKLAAVLYGFASPENVYCHDQMPIMLLEAGNSVLIFPRHSVLIFRHSVLIFPRYENR